MIRSFLLPAVVLLLPATLQAESKEKELEKLQGKWSVELIEENGVREPDDEAKRFIITIKTTTMIVDLAGREESIDFTIDPDQMPKTIDLTANYGTEKGKVTPGIYELDGDRLRICARPRGERPKEFTSEKGILTLVLKRQKD